VFPNLHFHFTFHSYHGATAPQGAKVSSLSRIHDHRHTTLGTTPLDGGSAQCRDLYQKNTQHSQQTDIHVPGGIRTRNPSKRAAAEPMGSAFYILGLPILHSRASNFTF